MTTTQQSRDFGSTWSRRRSALRFAANQARPEVVLGLIGVPVSYLGASSTWQQVLGVGVSIGFTAAGLLRRQAQVTFERTHSTTSVDIEVRRADHGKVVELSRRITATVHLATNHIDGGRVKWHGAGELQQQLRPVGGGYRVLAHPLEAGAYDIEYVLDDWVQRGDVVELGFSVALPQEQPWNDPFITTDLTTLDLAPWAEVRMSHLWDPTARIATDELLAYEYSSRQAYERKRAPRRLPFTELPGGRGVELVVSPRDAQFCFFGHRRRVPLPVS